MNVLIVYAHPEPHSFNGAMKDLALETLRSQGHDVALSDLYSMAFRPVAGRSDFTDELLDSTTLNLAREQTHAYEKGSLAEDILIEQEKIRRADIVLLQFPMWWFGMPAIMKGWADRVFTRGFAYDAGRKYHKGLLRGKAAMVSVTTGTSSETYAPNGIDGDILAVLWPIHNGLLRYCGFEVIRPFVAYMPGRVGAEGRLAYLNAYRERLLTLSEAPNLFFHPAEDYDADERLKPGVVARTVVQSNESGIDVNRDA